MIFGCAILAGAIGKISSVLVDMRQDAKSAEIERDEMNAFMRKNKLSKVGDNLKIESYSCCISLVFY